MDHTINDAELLRCYAEDKSETAFAELVHRYVDLVYSAALRQLSGDAHRAQDVAQVVFTTLARKAGSLRNHPVLAGWLYTATQHAAAKAIRSEIRRHAREQEAHAMQQILGSGDAAIEWDQVRPVLDAAMSDLGERDREAVLLRYFARRPFAEIGATLRSSEDAARMRVERALDKLRDGLARRGVTSTATALGVVLTQHAAAVAPAGLAAQMTGTAISGAAAAAFDLVAFMSTTKFIGVSAAAVVLLTMGTAVHHVRGERTASAALAGARQEHAVHLARLRALEQRNAAAQQELAELQRSLDEARAADRAREAPRTGRTSAAAPATAPIQDAVTAGNEFLARFPGVKQALLERSFARIRARYEPLYLELHLTPEQVDKLEQILLDGEGLSTNDHQLGPLNLRPGEGRSRAEMEQALRDLLGEDGYEKFREATHIAGMQQFTTDLAGALYFTDEPLTAKQAGQLGPVAARFPMRPAGDVMTRDWDGFFAAVRPLLTDRQFAVVARMRAQEEFAATMKFRMFK